MQNQLYPIFAATDIAIGGLGMDTQTIGYTFMICSVFIIFTQLAVFPRNELKYGALRCYRHGLLMLALFCVTCPLLSTVAKHSDNLVGDQYGTGIIKFLLQGSYLFWALLVVELYLLMHADAFAWTSMYILVSNAAPRKDYLGFINGLLNQVIGVTYMVGPLVSGYLWSWSLKHTLPYPFNSHLAWVASSLPLLVAWYMTLGIPESVNVFVSGSNEQNHSVSDDNQ
ncbi:hypothetical protein GGH99_003263 [Coemansia sp. RSA 1285]|nr:hypothetical protein GGH99_003263 [Coemansia sp. RSA 1285]